MARIRRAAEASATPVSWGPLAASVLATIGVSSPSKLCRTWRIGVLIWRATP